jgi:hypothetical protein
VKCAWDVVTHVPSALVLYAAVLVLAIAQALALLYGYRRRAAGRGGDAERSDAAPAAGARESVDGDRDGDEDGNTLVCPVCGARNDRFYRFCRQCVADLSTVTAVTREGGTRPTA